MVNFKVRLSGRLGGQDSQFIEERGKTPELWISKPIIGVDEKGGKGHYHRGFYENSMELKEQSSFSAVVRFFFKKINKRCIFRRNVIPAVLLLCENYFSAH